MKAVLCFQLSPDGLMTGSGLMVCSQPFPMLSPDDTAINRCSGVDQHHMLHTYYLNMLKLTERWSLWEVIKCSNVKKKKKKRLF